MKIRVPSYFNDFTCIASECEDTCCAGWGIVIDEETYNAYQNIDSEFGKKLRSKIVEEDGDNVFVLNGENCPFLSENKLCEIYKEVGAENLCYTCRQYPRYMEEFCDLREMGISLSCPEAARIIVRNSKVTEFELSEDNQVGENDDSMDKNVLEEFFLCRNIIINIIEMTH
ncbi:MAG: flagellin lysine-N-methylase, partial [Cellulosilyticaceae bacterium]